MKFAIRDDQEVRRHKFFVSKNFACRFLPSALLLHSKYLIVKFGYLNEVNPGQEFRRMSQRKSLLLKME